MLTMDLLSPLKKLSAGNAYLADNGHRNGKPIGLQFPHKESLAEM
jgi:hypothetical protein